MSTTRLDVENLFNHPKFEETSRRSWSQRVYYQLEEGELDISYSTGKCSLDKNTNGYDVDDGVVIWVEFHLKKPISIAKLDLDLSGFEKYKERDNDAIIYTNEDLGVQYTGSETKIRSIEFSPLTNHERFDCKNVLQKSE